MTTPLRRNTTEPLGRSRDATTVAVNWSSEPTGRTDAELVKVIDVLIGPAACWGVLCSAGACPAVPATVSRVLADGTARLVGRPLSAARGVAPTVTLLGALVGAGEGLTGPPGKTARR